MHGLVIFSGEAFEMNSNKNPQPPGTPPGTKTNRVNEKPPKPWEIPKPKPQPKWRIG